MTGEGYRPPPTTAAEHIPTRDDFENIDWDDLVLDGLPAED